MRYRDYLTDMFRRLNSSTFQRDVCVTVHGAAAFLSLKELMCINGLSLRPLNLSGFLGSSYISS